MTNNEQMPDIAYLMNSGGEKIWSAQHYMEKHGTKYLREDLVIRKDDAELADLQAQIENIRLQAGFFAQDGMSEDLMKMTLKQIDYVSELALASLQKLRGG